MNDVMTLLRAATATDVSLIAEVHVAAWRSAYAGIVPDSILHNLSVGLHAERWRTAISNGNAELWLAENDGKVLGWVAFSASRDADTEIETGEIRAIYIAPEHWRGGIGSALLNIAKERLKCLGFKLLTLWVLDQNTQAISFYKKQNLIPDGATKTIELGGVSLLELRLASSI